MKSDDGKQIVLLINGEENLQRLQIYLTAARLQFAVSCQCMNLYQPDDLVRYLEMREEKRSEEEEKACQSSFMGGWSRTRPYFLSLQVETNGRVCPSLSPNDNQCTVQNPGADRTKEQ